MGNCAKVKHLINRCVRQERISVQYHNRPKAWILFSSALLRPVGSKAYPAGSAEKKIYFSSANPASLAKPRSAGTSERWKTYPHYLTGLFCCSHGTLGVVTKASIRIWPINEETPLTMVAFDDFASSPAFVKEICRRNTAENAIIWNGHFYTSYEIKFSPDHKAEIPLGVEASQ